MRLKTKVRACVTAAALLATTLSYGATLTNSKGTFNDWGGFDWNSNGTAVVQDFNATMGVNEKDPFSLTYYANAASVKDVNGNTIVPATIGLLDGSYEYTIRATLNETATCTANNGTICTAASFAINAGAFEIWYDTTPDSNMKTGAGITDGVLLIAGTLGFQAGGAFDVLNGGNALLRAVISMTNVTYIDPILKGSTAFTTLQIGNTTTGWTSPTSLPGSAGGTMALPANPILLQADGNQDFIPEPGTIALIGAALGGLGLLRRKQNPL